MMAKEGPMLAGFPSVPALEFKLPAATFFAPFMLSSSSAQPFPSSLDLCLHAPVWLLEHP